MEDIDKYLHSPEFLQMADVTLYQLAIDKLEQYFAQVQELPVGQDRPVKRSQVKGLQEVSNQEINNKEKKTQLMAMAKNQLGKALKRLKDPKIDKSSSTMFWKIVKDAIENNDKLSFSLTEQTRDILETKNLLPELKKQQKIAKEKIFKALSRVFFEHFCCHFYYLAGGK